MNPIKRMAELTFAELTSINYNSEEYRQIIDLECAHAGISLLPEYPGQKPTVSETKPDAMLYKIGNVGFASITDAQDVLEFMVSKGIYTVEHISSIQVLKPMKHDDYYWPTVNSTPAFTPETFATVKDVIADATAITAIWKEKEDEYNAIYKERKTIIEKFDQAVQYANEVLTGIAKITDNLKRYLVLAQGSYPIAVTFLKEADKHGTVQVDEDDSVYYFCSSGVKHPVMTREQFQKTSMNNLLDI